MLANLPWAQFCKDSSFCSISGKLQLALSSRFPPSSSGGAKRVCQTNLSHQGRVQVGTSQILDSTWDELNQLNSSKPVYLTKSKIHQIGLFAKEIIQPEKLVLEYLGEVLDQNVRKIIESRNRQKSFTIRYLIIIIKEVTNKNCIK